MPCDMSRSFHVSALHFFFIKIKNNTYNRQQQRKTTMKWNIKSVYYSKAINIFNFGKRRCQMSHLSSFNQIFFPYVCYVLSIMKWKYNYIVLYCFFLNLLFLLSISLFSSWRTTAALQVINFIRCDHWPLLEFKLCKNHQIFFTLNLQSNRWISIGSVRNVEIIRKQTKFK